MQYFLGTRRIAERYLGSTLIYKRKEEEEVIYTDGVISANLPFVNKMTPILEKQANGEYYGNISMPSNSTKELIITLDVTGLVTLDVEAVLTMSGSYLSTIRAQVGGNSIFSIGTTAITNKLHSKKEITTNGQKTLDLSFYFSKSSGAGENVSFRIHDLKITGRKITKEVVFIPLSYTGSFDEMFSRMPDRYIVSASDAKELKLVLDTSSCNSYTLEIEASSNTKDADVLTCLASNLEDFGSIQLNQTHKLFDISGKNESERETYTIKYPASRKNLYFKTTRGSSSVTADEIFNIYSVKVIPNDEIIDMPDDEKIIWTDDHCIKSTVPFVNNMEPGFEKITDRWKSKAITHNATTRGYLELNTAGFSSYDVIIEASVSSENNFDFLTAYAKSTLSTAWDGTTDNVLKISGTVSKTTYMKTFPAESKFLHFFYRKDGSGSVGSDCGWIDSITIIGNK